jgi:hypothetical protein
MKDHTNAKIQRSRIEDIPVLGEELAEERLRLVSGGWPIFPIPPRQIATTKTKYKPTCSGGGRFGCGTSKPDFAGTYSDTLP